MQFSAIVNRFIVKTELNSIFTNDFLKKDFIFRKMFIVADLVSLNNAVDFINFVKHFQTFIADC